MIKPLGYMLLIEPWYPPEKTEAGIYLADESRDRDQIMAVVSKVVDMGPDAYQDKARFPNGPWCAVGDWVLVGRMAGAATFKYEGREFRFINDDKILGIVDDPSKVKRV